MKTLASCLLCAVVVSAVACQAVEVEFVALRGGTVIIRANESGSANLVCYIKESQYLTRDTTRGTVFWNRYNLSFPSPGTYSFDVDMSKLDRSTQYTLVVVNQNSGSKWGVPLQRTENAASAPSNQQMASTHNNPGAQTCFIATAAYGTPWESNVIKLRLFRERWLMNSEFGRGVVQSYYNHSPRLAVFIASHQGARFTTRIVLTPLVVIAGAMLGDPYDLLLAFASVIAVIILGRHWRKLLLPLPKLINATLCCFFRSTRNFICSTFLLLCLVSIGALHAQGQVQASVNLGHSKPVGAVAFSADAKYIVSGSRDRTVKLWDVRSGRLLRTFLGHTEDVLSVTFSPDSKRVASGGADNLIKIWDITSGQELKSWQAHTRWVNGLAYAQDGSRLASCGGWQGQALVQNEVVAAIWNPDHGSRVAILDGHSSGVKCIAYSPDGKRIFTGAWNPDSRIKIWNSLTGKCEQTINGNGPIESLAVSSDGQFVAAGLHVTGQFKVWQIANASLMKTMEGYSTHGTVVAFMPGAKQLIVGNVNSQFAQVNIDNLTLGNVYGKDEPDEYKKGAWVQSLALSANGGQIATGHLDSFVRLWDTATGACLKSLPPK